MHRTRRFVPGEVVDTETSTVGLAPVGRETVQDRVYGELRRALIGGLFSDADAYRYLPRSVAYLPPPDELLAQLREAGFSDASRRLLSVGISQLLTGTRDR